MLQARAVLWQHVSVGPTPRLKEGIKIRIPGGTCLKRRETSTIHPTWLVPTPLTNRSRKKAWRSSGGSSVARPALCVADAAEAARLHDCRGARFGFGHRRQ